jgi:WD40 repeat protein
MSELTKVSRNCNISHLPLYSLKKVNEHAWITGGADHSIHLFNLKNNIKVQSLYEKKFGHSDWITCSSFDDKRIIGGAMDGQISIWKFDISISKFIGERMIDIGSPVSDIQSKGAMYVSSYDGNISRFSWGNTGIDTVYKCIGSKSPVMLMSSPAIHDQSNVLLSAHKNGTILLYNTEQHRVNPIVYIRAHEGPITWFKTGYIIFNGRFVFKPHIDFLDWP